jgi:hypothetical protein
VIGGVWVCAATGGGYGFGRDDGFREGCNTNLTCWNLLLHFCVADWVFLFGVVFRVVELLCMTYLLVYSCI